MSDDKVHTPEVFRKKPVDIEAMHLLISNAQSVAQWCGGDLVYEYSDLPTLRISTLEGLMTASTGDWIVKGVKGEFYPVREDIFHATYERV